MKSIVLSRDQEVALSRIAQWINGPDPFFILDGPAGSGKTEIARLIGVDKIKMFCTPTGKAANVLRGRGVEACTVHRALYKPLEKSRIKLQGMMEELIAIERMMISDTSHQLIVRAHDLKAAIKRERRNTASPSWSVPPDAPIKAAELVVIDEYSMLDERVVGDLRANAKKVLFLGDPYQLPPVNGRCPLSGKANFALTEVHRQALENPILYALTKMREGSAPPPSRSNEHGIWENISKNQATWEEHYGACDQLIVAKNATRAMFNGKYRRKLGMSGVIDKGERVIFLRNNYDTDTFNGSTAKIIDFTDDGDIIELFAAVDGGSEALVDVWSGVLHGKYIEDAPRGAQAIDYGYAITCHKAQGSEYDHVVVWNEQLSSTDHRRWMYTAASRAKQRCTFINMN